MKLILMGDVNLMDVTNPAEPFRKILGELHAADVVFGNLECCLHLPASRHSDTNEGFFADPVVARNFLDPQLFEPIAGTPEQLTDYLGSETQKWSKVIRDGNIKGE